MQQWAGDPDEADDRASDMRENSATYAKRRRQAGWRRVTVWVPEDRVSDLQAFVKEVSEDRMPRQPALGSRWEAPQQPKPTTPSQPLTPDGEVGGTALKTD